MLPFSLEQFVAVLASYGQAIWPAQVFAYLLGVVAIAALFARDNRADRIIVGILALMWVITGIGYHLLFFTKINSAAYLFGALFVVQAAAFAYMTVANSRPRFGFPGGVSGWLGVALVAYSAVVYPAIGLWTGHKFIDLPAFGVTPCPVTLFTFGLLLLTTSRVPGWLLIIPGLWSLIGGTAAFLLNVPQDWVLLFSGVLSVPILYFRDWHKGIIARA